MTTHFKHEMMDITGYDKDKLVILAKLSEQTERYDDMVHMMKRISVLGEPLTSEERNLFSVAYKNVVGARRSAWRVLVSIKQREEQRAEDETADGPNEYVKRAKLTDDYINEISKEIEDICRDVVDLVDDYLLKGITDSDDHESKTFYLKMKGDYHRYVAEVKDSETQTVNSDKANEAYSEAYKICTEYMEPSHPIRLGLALNYSVFYYEIKVEHPEACRIAKEALKKAKEGLATESEGKQFKDSNLIMQLLRDNLSLWTASEEEDESDQQMEA